MTEDNVIWLDPKRGERARRLRPQGVSPPSNVEVRSGPSDDSVAHYRQGIRRRIELVSDGDSQRSSILVRDLGSGSTVRRIPSRWAVQHLRRSSSTDLGAHCAPSIEPRSTS